MSVDIASFLCRRPLNLHCIFSVDTIYVGPPRYFVWAPCSHVIIFFKLHEHLYTPCQYIVSYYNAHPGPQIYKKLVYSINVNANAFWKPMSGFSVILLDSYLERKSFDLYTCITIIIFVFISRISIGHPQIAAILHGFAP